MKIADLRAASGVGDGEAINAGSTIRNGDISPYFEGAVSVVVTQIRTRADGSEELLLRTEDSNLALIGFNPILGNDSGVLSLDANGKIRALSFTDRDDGSSIVFSPCGSAKEMQPLADELAKRAR